MKIGIYDSGLGGLTVLNQAMDALPNEKFMYFADTENGPYGNRSSDEILKLSETAVDYLIDNGCKAVVIACNTATSVAAEYLRSKYPSIPIIGMEPAVKPAVLKHARSGRILLVATQVTINGEKLTDLIAKYDKDRLVDKIALKKLAAYAENGVFSKEQIIPYLKEEFKNLNLNDYSVLILGCTHYNFYKDSFKELLPSIRIIDGSKGTVEQLKRRLAQEHLLSVLDESEPEVSRVTYVESCTLVTDKSELRKIDALNRRFRSLHSKK